MSTVVLYIAGTGRSGSTVLANILGEVDGVFAAGEVRYLWQRGLKEGRLCGCGLPVRECPVWSKVLARAGELDDPALVDGIVSMLQRTGRIRNLPGVLAGAVVPRLDPAEAHALGPARSALGDLYSAIAEVTRCRVIVNSSKLPAYANVLAATPGIDLRVVHLIRDPRGAAHSWASKKTLADGAARAHMEQIGPAKSALLWDVWNLAGGVLFKGGADRYLRLRYEDFVADPPGSVRAILRMVGMDAADLPFVNGNEAQTTPNHSVAGNPDRLRHGAITLRSDDRWKSAMAPRNRRLVSVLTSPLLLRYGYPLRPEAGTAATDETIFDRAPAGEGAGSRLARRVRRHLRWGRTEGFSRLVEEDELNPLTRVRVAAAKWEWRRAHPRPAGLATPVYVVGLQRSGTNMLARGLDVAPEFEVHNENDSAVFDHFLLRDDDVVRRVVLASRQEYVLFKPLCDSHRVDHLLELAGHTISRESDLGVPRRRRPCQICGLEVRQEQSAHSPRHRRGQGRRHVAGAAAVAGDARGDSGLRLLDDVGRDRGGAVLVDSKRSLFRDGSRPSRRCSPRLLPGHAGDPRRGDAGDLHVPGSHLPARAHRAHLAPRHRDTAAARH